MDALKKISSHENLRDHGPKKTATDKSFGLVFATVFALIAAFQTYAGRLDWAVGLAGAAVLMLILAFMKPALLAPLNKIWSKFGLLLHKVTNPLIMGMIYFVVCTPMGVVMRIFGYDPLRTKMDPEAETYWIKRDPPGPTPDTMKHQF